VALTRRARIAVVVAAASLVATRAAVADEPVARAFEAPPDRPHTVAVIEAGIIALPTAPISAAFQGGATPFGRVGKGDATVLTGLHLLYRTNREWAIGATAMFAPRPTSDPYTGSAGNVTRTHTRSYLVLGGEARYYPLRLRWLEGWIGAEAGGVVIADRFTTNAPPVPSFLGTTTVTVSTEGFALGLQAGADYLFADQWVLGLAARADSWLLPTSGQKPFSQISSCDAVGDCPTVSGGVLAFEFGITLGYKLPL
jgi:hypothetical protein